MRLRSFFSYYGSKARIASKYPIPQFERIVEPFAGAAAYSLCYPSKRVTLYDLNPIIAGLWEYLIRASEAEIRNLPTEITDLREMKLLQEQKWLIGFWIGKGDYTPRKKPSAWSRSAARSGTYWSSEIRGTIASQLQYIRHWKVRNASYDTAPDKRVTWFVDPPYQGKPGRKYTFNEIDFDHLAAWCKSRRGQVIVCENAGADWLPFIPFISQQSGGRVRYDRKALKQGKKQHRVSCEVVYYQTDKGRAGLFSE